MSQCVYIASGFFLSIFVYWSLSPSRSKLALPPGPRKLPIIKNLLDFPLKEQWLTFTRWSKEYKSDIIHAEAAGKSLVILNSYEAMTDLLDKRSVIYSSRAVSRVVNEMIGWKWNMGFMPYNDAWKARRRLMVKHIHRSNTPLHRAHERHQLHIFLKHMLNDSENFLKHARHMTGAATISMAYGIKVEEANDQYVQVAENTLTHLSEAFLPGNFLVDTFYWLRHIPEGFPGTSWKIKVKKLQHEMEEFRDKPYQAALEALANGICADSFVSRCQHDINEGNLMQEEQTLVRDAAAVIFTGGAETTVSVLSTLFLALICYPDVYKKAQAEVDQVLDDRLSEDSDRSSLPYLSALLRELLRWQSIIPMGVPHSVIQEDEYQGYYIPADSLVIPNVCWVINSPWPSTQLFTGAVFHNPELFPEPDIFDPERFLKNCKLHVSGPDPLDLTFGFGRRTCLGRNIAESMMFHVAASMLSLFNITKALDDDGKPVEPSHEFTNGITRQPVPFKCSIKPRSQHAVKFICSL